jgi:hypothetical protein
MINVGTLIVLMVFGLDALALEAARQCLQVADQAALRSCGGFSC